MIKPKIVVLSGAGMSAESGLSTFRDAGGLWEGHDVMQVASPQGWESDMDLVLEFYNQRRRQLLTAHPNPGHLALKLLEAKYDVVVITQNVDDLHERGGSDHIIHLHGELLKARSSRYSNLVYQWTHDINRGDVCEGGAQLRPHIVWFGEAVPLMDEALRHVTDADIVIVIGTSMQVYPAAGLVYYAPSEAELYYIDPRPQMNHELSLRSNLRVIKKTAGEGVPALVEELLRRMDT